MKEKYQILGLAIVMLIMFSIVGHMELKLEKMEEDWQSSRQAIEVEQEKIQLDILEVREELAAADEQLHSFNLLIWEMRERLHLDLEVELAEEGDTDVQEAQ